MNELYKVLIVDDEAFAREGLTSMIDWEACGFTLVGEAEDGQQALKIIAELQPDLVIADIVMPEMNGIEMIKYVRKHMRYQPDFVILSNYGTFEYAKEIMRLGVERYILKPFIRSETQENLKEIKKAMDKRRQEELVNVQTNRKLQLLSRKYLMRLLEGVAVEEEKFNLDLILNLKGRKRQMLAIKIKMESEEERIRELLMQTFIRLGCVPELYEMIFVTPNFIVVFADETDICLEDRLSTMLKELSEDVHIIMNLGQVKDCQDIVEVWKKVATFMEYSFYRGNRSRVFKDADLENCIRINSGYCQDIVTAPEKKELMGVEQITTYCNRLRNLNVQPTLIQVFILARLMEIKTESMEEEVYRLHQQVPYLLFDELKNIWIQLVQEEKANLRTEDVDGLIEQYVRCHFQENIVLQDVAMELHYNEIYLGKLIKKKTGMSFRQYLNKVRLDYAEKLLLESFDSVIEIAHKSGFSNPDYFCKKFRERNGMTPSEFRKR